MININKILIKSISIVAAVALGTAVGWPVMSTPIPLDRDADFSAYRMADHIRIIAAEERSVFHPEQRLIIRDYIIDVMNGFGLEAEIDDFESTITDYADREVTLEGSNVLFRQYGRSDTAIMLMAHYDSRGVNWTLDPETEVHSLGAADSGYGIAVMFEIARYWSEREPENSIYYFFTDLEEIGLLGAIHAVESMDFSNVSLILNLEARGIRGPVYMFETNVKDYNVVRFFKESTSHRLSYSVATALYRIMPNLTDLTPFLEQEFNGMNFAPINSLLYYHTERDIYENISHTTMQQYIDMIAALVESFVTNSSFSDMEYFQADHAAVFFPLPFDLFVLYADHTAVLISFVMLALVIALLAYLKLQGKLCLRKTLLWALYIVSGIVAATLLGIVTTLAIFIFNTDMPIHMIRLQGEKIVIWFGVAVMLVLLGLFHIRMGNRFNRREMVVGAMLLLAVINLLMSFFLVGATFMVLFPMAAAYVCHLPTEIDSLRRTPLFLTLLNMLVIFFLAVLFGPLMYSIARAASISGLFIVFALSVLLTASLLPVWRKVELQK